MIENSSCQVAAPLSFFRRQAANELWPFIEVFLNEDARLPDGNAWGFRYWHIRILFVSVERYCLSHSVQYKSYL